MDGFVLGCHNIHQRILYSRNYWPSPCANVPSKLQNRVEKFTGKKFIKKNVLIRHWKQWWCWHLPCYPCQSWLCKIESNIALSIPAVLLHSPPIPLDLFRQYFCLILLLPFFSFHGLSFLLHSSFFSLAPSYPAVLLHSTLWPFLSWIIPALLSTCPARHHWSTLIIGSLNLQIASVSVASSEIVFISLWYDTWQGGKLG